MQITLVIPFAVRGWEERRRGIWKRETSVYTNTTEVGATPIPTLSLPLKGRGRKWQTVYSESTNLSAEETHPPLQGET